MNKLLIKNERTIFTSFSMTDKLVVEEALKRMENYRAIGPHNIILRFGRFYKSSTLVASKIIKQRLRQEKRTLKINFFMAGMSTMEAIYMLKLLSERY
ncbi:hypothetical protein Lal_00018825 [Lupinus albus]|nr:hypothetical protein Lal_00018825 [Lupinus albus]